MPPYFYLGHILQKGGIKPQKMQFDYAHLTTLHDWQHFLGDVQWICPSLSMKSGDLKPLYDILPRDTDPLIPLNA